MPPLRALLGLERQWSGGREKPAADPFAAARTRARWAAHGTLYAWFGPADPAGQQTVVLVLGAGAAGAASLL